MNTTTYGLNLAKRVFQLYWVNGETGEIVNRRFGRQELIEFAAPRAFTSPNPKTRSPRRVC